MVRDVSRHLVVCDTETLGLGDHHPAIEVAYWNLTTGEYGGFLPVRLPEDLPDADPEALRVNRFFERGLDVLPQDESGEELAHLHELLAGNVIAGSNPGFDAKKLNLMFERDGRFPPSPWHHRMLDLACYSAGVLGLHPTVLPGLERICKLLGIEPGQHSAMTDVRAAGECLMELQRIANFQRTAS